jgi:hypothetical protein
MIESLPKTFEKLSHGSPTWWGGKRTFATYHGGNYDDGHRGVWVLAPMGVQEALIAESPERFYRPKYLGPSGWVGVRLDGDVDWNQVRFLLEQGHEIAIHKR